MKKTLLRSDLRNGLSNWAHGNSMRTSILGKFICTLFLLVCFCHPVFSSEVRIIGWFVDGKSTLQAYQGETVILVGDLDGEPTGLYRVDVCEKPTVTADEEIVASKNWRYSNSRGTPDTRIFWVSFEVPFDAAQTARYFAKIYRLVDGQWTNIFVQEENRLSVIKKARWIIEKIDSSPYVWGMTRADIALDNSGKPYAVYPRQADNDSKIYLALRTGPNQWKKEVVAPEYSHSPSVAVDSHNKPRVFAPEFSWNGGKYFTRGDNGWNSEPVVDAGCTGTNTQFSDMAIGKNDNAHIVFGTREICVGVIQGWVSKFTYYWQAWQPTHWLPFVTDARGQGASEAHCGWWPSIVLDNDDNIFMVHSYTEVFYSHGKRGATYSQITWDKSTIGSGTRASLALDSHSVPHVSYIYNGKLRYAYKDGIKWPVQEPAPNCFSTGSPSTIVVGVDDNPQICFVDQNTNTLRITRRLTKPTTISLDLSKFPLGQKQLDISIPAPRWTTPEVIDTFGYSTSVWSPPISMVIDKRTGVVHVVYFDGEVIKYAATSYEH